jgi:hypothetical protein
MSLQKQLKSVFDELLAEVGRNDELRQRLADILGGSAGPTKAPTRRSARRKPGPFDPMAVFREHPEHLSRRLDELSVEELKDMIAEHGMDRTKLARKWKEKDRLVELIVNAVKSRSQKGDAFRAAPPPRAGETNDGIRSTDES